MYKNVCMLHVCESHFLFNTFQSFSTYLSCLFFNINENKMHTIYSVSVIRQIDVSFNEIYYVFDVYSPHVFVIFSSMHVSSSPRPILAASKGRGI